MKKYLTIVLLIILMIGLLVPTVKANSTYTIQLEVTSNESNADFDLFMLLPSNYIIYAINNAGLDIEYTGAETLIQNDIPLINENLGRWVRHIIDRSYNNGFGKVKLATSTAIDAYKLLYLKEDSPYYVPEGSPTNMFNVYNAFTELISNDGTKEDRQGGDITNKAEKTLLLRDILQLV